MLTMPFVVELRVPNVLFFHDPLMFSPSLLSRTPSFKAHKRSISTSTQKIFSSLLNQCSNGAQLYQTHGFMVTRALDQDNLLLSQFINTCTSLGLLDHAYSAFSHKTHPNIYLYNTMIKALSGDHDEKAVLVYKKARVIGLEVDCYSFPFVLKAVTRLGDVRLGREVHCQVLCAGFDSNRHVGVGLIQMYSCCGCVSDARKVFDEMGVRDLACWNAMVAGYVKVGDVDSAGELFEVMPERNVISWTALISGYAQANRPNEGVAIFRRMLLEGVRPDEVAMLAALSACAHLGAIGLGEWIHNYIVEHGLRSVPLNNALIDMYAKSGNIKKALEIFEKMEEKSVVTWTTAIAGLAFHGHGRKAIEMFTHMEVAGIRPNDVTLMAVLSACSHGGLTALGRWHFNNMVSVYGIQPRIEHYGCMIDLLGRAGCLWEAQQLVRMMPFEANAAIWGSLLAASRTYGDIELGERALQHLIKAEPHNSGNYSLLSNIYAAVGLWDEAGTTRKVMRDIGVKKMSGRSCIELENVVHEFNSGDRSHPQSESIFEIVSQINRLLKMVAFMDIKHQDLLESTSILCDIF